MASGRYIYIFPAYTEKGIVSLTCSILVVTEEGFSNVRGCYCAVPHLRTLIMRPTLPPASKCIRSWAEYCHNPAHWVEAHSEVTIMTM